MYEPSRPVTGNDEVAPVSESADQVEPGKSQHATRARAQAVYLIVPRLSNGGSTCRRDESENPLASIKEAEKGKLYA